MQVEGNKFQMLSKWQREYTMEHILTQLKKEMAAPQTQNRKLVQPPDRSIDHRNEKIYMMDAWMFSC